MFQPDPNSVHFDLGVDHLANAAEVTEMHDPWTAMAHALPHPHGAEGVPNPPQDLEPWADDLELPGL